MKLFKLVWFIFTVVFCLSLDSSHACETFQEGSQAYFSGNYEQAILAYTQCLNDPSYALHSNLGSTYYKLGKMGKAHFHFLKAFQRNPKHQNLSFNLSLVQEALLDQEQPEFLEQVMSSGSFEYKILFFLVLVIGLGIVMKSKWGGWLLFLGILLSISWIVYQWNYLVEQPKYGVVMENRQSIFSNQNLHSSLLTDVHAGKLLRIVSEHGDWVQVKVQPGLQGWVPSNVIGRL
tara:strand:+ start:401 stop:1099 length:699 start_codon:yes stop_codon:yes gene_type:complete